MWLHILSIILHIAEVDERLHGYSTWLWKGGARAPSPPPPVPPPMLRRGHYRTALLAVSNTRLYVHRSRRDTTHLCVLLYLSFVSSLLHCINQET